MWYCIRKYIYMWLCVYYLYMCIYIFKQYNTKICVYINIYIYMYVLTSKIRVVLPWLQVCLTIFLIPQKNCPKSLVSKAESIPPLAYRNPAPMACVPRWPRSPAVDCSWWSWDKGQKNKLLIEWLDIFDFSMKEPHLWLETLSFPQVSEFPFYEFTYVEMFDTSSCCF